MQQDNYWRVNLISLLELVGRNLYYRILSTEQNIAQSTQMHHVNALSTYPVMITQDNNLHISIIKTAKETDNSIQTIKEILREKLDEDYFLKKSVKTQLKNTVSNLLLEPVGYLETVNKIIIIFCNDISKTLHY